MCVVWCGMLVCGVCGVVCGVYVCVCVCVVWCVCGGVCGACVWYVRACAHDLEPQQ